MRPRTGIAAFLSVLSAAACSPRARRQGGQGRQGRHFRGLTISGNVLYYTKGSGGNGVDTVYFLDTTGTARPDGVGLPIPGAPLPTTDGGRW